MIATFRLKVHSAGGLYDARLTIIDEIEYKECYFTQRQQTSTTLELPVAFNKAL